LDNIRSKRENKHKEVYYYITNIPRNVTINNVLTSKAMALRKTGWEDKDWIHLAQERNQQ
jgi:hypothetical protein